VLGVSAVPYIADSLGQALLADLNRFGWAKPTLRVERPSFQHHKDRLTMSLLIMVRIPRRRQRYRTKRLLHGPLGRIEGRSLMVQSETDTGLLSSRRFSVREGQ
jgi:hypothetical protein